MAFSSLIITNINYEGIAKAEHKIWNHDGNKQDPHPPLQDPLSLGDVFLGFSISHPRSLPTRFRQLLESPVLESYPQHTNQDRLTEQPFSIAL